MPRTLKRRRKKASPRRRTPSRSRPISLETMRRYFDFAHAVVGPASPDPATR